MPAPDFSQSASVPVGQAGAVAVVGWWQTVSDALAPVLGSRGVAALYIRSVHLASASHPFLVGIDATNTKVDLPALQALLIQQPESVIAAAGATFAAILTSLLEGLVGPSLTRRLLRDVQAPLISGSTAQDH